jgi:hypothetical protein
MTSFRPLLLVVLFAASGCTSYQPAEISSLQPREQVRLELDQTELARLLAFADPVRRTVSGRFINRMGDSVTIVVETPSAFMQVSVPRSSILQTNRRVIDNRKSFLVSVLVVGVAAAMALIGFEGGGEDSFGDDTGIDETLIPLLGFRIPFSLSFGR